MIYSNPRPIPQTISQHYGTDPEAYWPEVHLVDRRTFSDEIRVFRQLWKGNHTPRALDIGAGMGNVMSGLHARGFDTYGIEPSPQFRARAISNGVSADRLRLAAIEDAEFDPGAFDFVAFSAVLEHLHDPASAVERAFDWLADGGIVHVEVPSARWLMARGMNRVYRAQGLDYVTNLSPMHPPFHLYEFTVEAFRSHGMRAGYRVLFHQILSCPTFLPRSLATVATRVMDATGTNMQLQVWLTR